MSTTLTRWRDSAFAPFEWAGLLPMLAQEIRVEQYVDDSHYVVRAELAGYHPEKEIEISIIDGVLRIQAERAEEKHERSQYYRAHSEFRYGRFIRTIMLPSTVMEDTGQATYHNGVLEITFNVGEPKPSGRRIPIESYDEEGPPPISKYPTGKQAEGKPVGIHPGVHTSKEHVLAKEPNARSVAAKLPGAKTASA